MNTANVNVNANGMATTPVALDTTEARLQQQARRRVRLKVGFFIHALVFTLVNLGLLTLNAVTGGERGLPGPLWGWAFGLTIHGTVVFTKLQTQGLGLRLRERLVAQEVERLRAKG